MSQFTLIRSIDKVALTLRQTLSCARWTRWVESMILPVSATRQLRTRSVCVCEAVFCQICQHKTKLLDQQQCETCLRCALLLVPRPCSSWRAPAERRSVLVTLWFHSRFNSTLTCSLCHFMNSLRTNCFISFIFSAKDAHTSCLLYKCLLLSLALYLFAHKP